MISVLPGLDGVTMMSFDEFHANCYSKAYRSALRLTKNHEDAHDLTQEAFVRAYQSFSQHDPERSTEGWLTVIIHNLFLDQCRQAKRRPQTLSTTDLSDQHPTFELIDPEISAEEKLLANTFSEPIEAALSRLPEHDRQLVLSNLSDASPKALAASLGCSVGKINVKLQRAHVALKRMLLAEAMEPAR